jgi:hypothetical protein
MRDDKKEKWMALCEQAAEEQDPGKVNGTRCRD